MAAQARQAVEQFGTGPHLAGPGGGGVGQGQQGLAVAAGYPAQHGA